ncbi:uncharacterized protein TRAVEDRAFT_43446 [Trametes versicolor FP-101664 SS1]|uniref:uncharacterized protein n=1 Tax=Trametes versicolor (strain FP-101664) TaxID=717944 RepID=UPI0004622F37|nr:uncharacterized protein TRAVEDRAFT_43446 [Trametes versicolor FP-101664 SS1]EIW63140.1 hypothetical protein TRAVEDRAFT_43446 [Trametes versicolor FP-101664 SS1]
MSVKTPVKRKQPYSRPKDVKNSSKDVEGSMSTQPCSLASSSTSNTSNTSAVESSLPGSQVARQVYIEFMQEVYPNITPRDDHDLLILGSTRREGTTAEILAWVDKKMENHIKIFGSRKAVLANAKELLDCIVGVTGVKPRPGRDIAHIRPIPGSKYSIRLWPGNPFVNEYCMDFVDTVTNRPVNSPFAFELWAVPDPKSPWLALPSGRLHSLERSFHVARDKILPGEEKWVLRDGQTCLLKRPGKRDVMFTVPIRQQPQTVQYDVDILDFPKVE